MPRNFQRMGQPVIVSVSPTSAATPVPVTMPKNVTSFMVWNPTLYDVRLEGSQPSSTFNAVTSTTGWPCPSRTWSGPFRTKNPDRLSAAEFASPGIPIPSGYSGVGDYIELIYGDGE